MQPTVSRHGCGRVGTWWDYMREQVSVSQISPPVIVLMLLTQNSFIWIIFYRWCKSVRIWSKEHTTSVKSGKIQNLSDFLLLMSFLALCHCPALSYPGVGSLGTNLSSALTHCWQISYFHTTAILQHSHQSFGYIFKRSRPQQKLYLFKFWFPVAPV